MNTEKESETPCLGAVTCWCDFQHKTLIEILNKTF
jgi:hypothetical protein